MTHPLVVHKCKAYVYMKAHMKSTRGEFYFLKQKIKVIPVEEAKIILAVLSITKYNSISC